MFVLPPSLIALLNFLSPAMDAEDKGEEFQVALDGSEADISEFTSQS